MANGIEQRLQTRDAIEDQLVRRDPFVEARRKSERRNILRTAEAFEPQENPLDVLQQPLGRVEPEPERVPEISLGTALAPSREQISDFRKSDLPELLVQSGLRDITSRLSFTPLGRIQLQTELQRKFGSEFQSNPEAQRIMAAFTAQLAKQDKRAVDDEMTKIESRGRRTLNALLGGL